MRRHVVISKFKAAGGYVSPPGPWTPPSEQAAERLVRSGCIRLPTESEERRFSAPGEPAKDGGADPAEAGKAIETPSPKKKTSSKGSKKKAGSKSS